MKSRGLFPGPSSRPKRTFKSAAGSPPVEPKVHTDDGTGGYTGMVGWKSGRMAGGQSVNQSGKGVPRNAGGGQFDKMAGEGGLSWDASMAPYLADKGKPS